MIKNQDRSRYIGASDTSFVVGNWETDTFFKWWQSKMGLNFRPKFQNRYTLAGTFYEHALLDTIPLVEKDKQIIIPELHLRVNYDGNVGDKIIEVKTFKDDKEFKVSKTYWRQAQVEMYAMGSKELTFLAYPLSEEHYKNYFIPIDKRKRIFIPCEYDPQFIREYLPKLKYMGMCMEHGRFPIKRDYERWLHEEHIKQTS